MAEMLRFSLIETMSRSWAQTLGLRQATLLHQPQAPQFRVAAAQHLL